jgi:hypothetical protein
MKKLTAKRARRLSLLKANPKTMTEVIAFLVSEAKNGHNNTFIDGKEEVLEFIANELNSRGFKAGLERYTQTPFLSVYW